MPLARSVQFSASARLLAAEAQRRGLVVPSFRCPPRAPGVVRAIRRLPGGGALVAVQVRGRDHAAVVADMVEGVVVANGLEGAAAATARDELLAAVGEMAEPGGRTAA
jgi:hypothetical protein